MRTLIGWGERIGDTAGIQKNFDQFMPQLVETFFAFERDYPEASTLQAFRFQIAQEYYGAAMLVSVEKGVYVMSLRGLDPLKPDYYRNQARKWLNLVIEQAGEQYTFYRDIAARYLEFLSIEN